MPEPVLTLTTDFGLSDHYVGTMKGVILSICPQARIVDISHDVTPYEIAEGAYLLAQAYRYFPKKTVHVVVVDPGVGTARRPILMQAAGQYFIAPDNGVLSMVYSREEHKIRAITNEKLLPQTREPHLPWPRYFRPRGGAPGWGRAALHHGRAHPRLSPPVVRKAPAHRKTHLERPNPAHRPLRQHRHQFPHRRFPGLERRNLALHLGPDEVTVMVRNYAECGPGELFFIIGSSGYLEVSMNQGSAARKVGCATGSAGRINGLVSTTVQSAQHSVPPVHGIDHANSAN